MFRASVLGATLLLAVSCSSRPPGESNYVGSIAEARAAKDAALRGATEPITADTRDKFLPLVYFPIDTAYSVPATFTEDPPAARQHVEMETSTHQPRQMERLGTLAFTLRGQLLHLAAYHEVGDSSDRLFVPFTDLTSGKETYRAGRYLDIARSRTGVYVVDFNEAYNPYCYYNSTYDCPYPPRENRLPVAITAGEKIR